MDVLNRVREWNVAPDDTEDLSAMRSRLLREIAATTRTQRRRRYGFTVGAVGGALGLSGVAVMATGVLTVGTVVSPTPVAFVPAAAAADEIVTRVATKLESTAIPAGKYLKTTVVFEQTVMLQPEGAIEPFMWIRSGALGALTTRWIDSSYISADGAEPLLLETSSYQPVAASGDEQAVHDAWNAYYGSTYGNWDDIIDSPRPSTVMDSGIRSDLEGSTDPLAARSPLDLGTDVNGTPLVEGEGLLSDDPAEFLDAVAATLPEGATRDDAVGEVFRMVLNAQGSAIPLESEQLALYLRAIALSDEVVIEATDGSLTTLLFENDDAVRRLVVDTDTDTLVEASERLKQVRGASDELQPLGESPMIPRDAPTTVFRYTQEIVDAAPAVTPGG